jgi:hypothetical protein
MKWLLRKHLESKVRVQILINDEKKIISLKADYEDVKSISTDLNYKGVKISLSKLKTIIEAEVYKSVLDEKEIIIK